MTREGIAKLISGLSAASGRNLGMAEAEVYGSVLYGIGDDVGLDAGQRLWGFVSWDRPPSPGMVLEQAQAIMRARRAETAALPDATGEPVSEAMAREQLAKIRDILASAPGPLAVPLRGTVRKWPVAGAEYDEGEGE